MAVETNTSIPISNLKRLFQSKDMMMAFALVIMVVMMLIPLPSFVLDLIVVLNLAVSLGIILLTMYTTHALEFSVFPSLLLLVTLFRLAINISASRLILLNGEAGLVIDTFGKLVVGGNYVVGVIIFIMLMIIQFAVINNGAGRVSEVTARFTLDAMPGKQMAIDADLNAGIINEFEAQQRRKDVQVEANFYGAMDGASKFVKGDAIAAIIVMIVNIVGGFVIGMVQYNMAFDVALQNYTVLTVGAGLAVQVPALLISAASGLIVTRSQTEASLGSDLVSQLSNFKVLFAGAAIMVLMALIPGMPKLPFLMVGLSLGGIGYMIWRAAQVETVVEEPEEIAPALETPEEMMRSLIIDPIELEVGYGLIPLVDEDRADNLLRQITNIRRQLISELGFVLPVVRIRDNLRLQPQNYRIKIRGEEIAKGEILIDRYLAIPNGPVDESIKGVATTEPAFGMPALWISESEKGKAEIAGYTVVNPLAMVSTHLTEIIRAHSSELLSRQMLKEMLDQLRQHTPAAVDGLIPELLTLGELQEILRNLLKERIPVRDLSGMLETLSKHAHVTRDTNILAEAVRQTMSLTLSNLYREPDGQIHSFTLSPKLEATLRETLNSADGGFVFQIDAATAQAILQSIGEQMENLAKNGHMPILLCSRELRLAIRKLVEMSFNSLVVMAFSEISTGTKVTAHGMVEIN
ncbi:MAG: flagellar biosynthesis protein FlhA [Anaerolineaceae bacterium]|nr:flagellar biosynthesis protein FlhA [Anaerolineaceae bacterium]